MNNLAAFRGMAQSFCIGADGSLLVRTFFSEKKPIERDKMSTTMTIEFNGFRFVKSRIMTVRVMATIATRNEGQENNDDHHS
jgi:hypothetical protein